jgi:hypothetical protein
MTNDWMPPEVAKAVEKLAKIEASYPPAFRKVQEQMHQLLDRLRPGQRNYEPKAWTPENDPAVPKEFLVHYRDLKDNRFLVGMMVRAYLRLQKKTPHSRVNPQTLRAAVFAEYKTKHGQEPSAANFARGLRQARLGSLVGRGRPKKRK